MHDRVTTARLREHSVRVTLDDARLGSNYLTLETIISLHGMTSLRCKQQVVHKNSKKTS